MENINKLLECASIHKLLALSGAALILCSRMGQANPFSSVWNNVLSASLAERTTSNSRFFSCKVGKAADVDPLDGWVIIAPENLRY